MTDTIQRRSRPHNQRHRWKSLKFDMTSSGKAHHSCNLQTSQGPAKMQTADLLEKPDDWPNQSAQPLSSLDASQCILPRRSLTTTSKNIVVKKTSQPNWPFIQGEYWFWYLVLRSFKVRRMQSTLGISRICIALVCHMGASTVTLDYIVPIARTK